MNAAPRKWTIDAGTNVFAGCVEPHEHVATCPGCFGRQKDHHIEVEAETATDALLRGLEMLARIIPPGTVIVCAHVAGETPFRRTPAAGLPARN